MSVQTVLGQDAAPLPVGTYNVINTAYGGYSQTVAGVTTNWLASTSLTLVPLLSFTVVAVCLQEHSALAFALQLSRFRISFWLTKCALHD